MKPRSIALASVFVIGAGVLLALRSCGDKMPQSEGEAMNSVPSAKVVIGEPGNGSLNPLTWRPSEEEIAKMESTEAVFYGRVVDQFGAPVKKAEVTYEPNYDPNVSKGRGGGVTTDADGRFSIIEQNAPDLLVRVLAPSGYSRTGTLEDTVRRVSYARIPDSAPPELKKIAVPPHKGDINNPTIFRLRKFIDTEPMVHRSTRKMLGAEQEFVVGLKPEHLLKLTYWLDPNSERIDKQTEKPMYDWNAELSVPGGGWLNEAIAIPMIRQILKRLRQDTRKQFGLRLQVTWTPSTIRILSIVSIL